MLFHKQLRGAVLGLHFNMTQTGVRVDGLGCHAGDGRRLPANSPEIRSGTGPFCSDGVRLHRLDQHTSAIRVYWISWIPGGCYCPRGLVFQAEKVSTHCQTSPPKKSPNFHPLYIGGGEFRLRISPKTDGTVNFGYSSRQP